MLAHAGVGSRRACEELILQGRVTVDAQVVRELGTRVDPTRSQIAVDGQPIRVERPVYFAVSKPKGYVSTNSDPAGRPRVVDLLPEIPQRVYTVGRLDEMSVGLMILTNDGELANKLAHPKYGVEKIYRAVVAGTPSREVLDKLTEGVWLAEGKVRAKRVRPVAHKGEATILELVLAEGKNREVRRMLARLGHKVMSLTRVAVGPILLKGLKPGESRPLSGYEVDLLRRVAAGLPVPTARPERPRPDRRPTRGPGRSQGPSGPSGRPQASAGPAGRETYRGPGRPAGPGPRPRPGTLTPGGPARRPLGPPPSGRRPAPPPSGRRPGPPPRDEPAPRRVIGMDAAGEGEGPPRPRARRPAPRGRGPGGPPRRPSGPPRRPSGPSRRPGGPPRPGRKRRPPEDE